MCGAGARQWRGARMRDSVKLEGAMCVRPHAAATVTECTAAPEEKGHAGTLATVGRHAEVGPGGG